MGNLTGAPERTGTCPAAGTAPRSCSRTSASSHKPPGFVLLWAVWGHNSSRVLGPPGTRPEPRDPKRHHGPGAPTAGETQTLPKARQWCLRGGEGLEALPKALHEHGDDESSENTLRSLSQPLIFSAWHFVPFKLKQKKAQPSTAELRLRQSWGCPQPRGTKPRWQQHFQGHLS